MKVRVLTALLAVLVVLAGVWVNSLGEGHFATQQIPTPVDFGQDSEVSSVSIHLHEARVVEQLVSRDQVLPTSGVWVVVDFSYAAHTRATFFSTMMLVSEDGRQYERTQRAAGTLPMAEADLWQRVEFAFEVPADALGEMTLEVYVEPRWLIAPVRFGRADLVLDAGDAEPGPVELRAPELLPAGQR